MDTHKLLEVFTNQLRKEKNSIPYNFNILDEQCGHIVENSHTNILMKILQYKNQHGYVFLKSFFEYVGISLQIATEESEPIVFVREKSTKGQQKNGKIDGFIYQKNKFALIIENKINHAPPTQQQIKTYIQGIKDDSKISDIQIDNDLEKVWVIYLTEDGNERPDDESIEEMRRCGILDEPNNNEPEEISGPRYFAINYKDDILPWLKEEIQPMVMQREQVLNTGLLQYIDYLEGMFGIRQQDLAMKDKCKGILDNIDMIKELKQKDFAFKNQELLNIVNELKVIQNKLVEEDYEESKLKYNAAIIIKKLTEEINEEPMQNFYNITREFFKARSIKECVIRSEFKYKYIQIRDASWPPSIHFEWFPFSIDRLTDGLNKNYTLCFHVENVKYHKSFEDQKVQEAFNNCSFSLKGKSSRTLSFVRGVKTPSTPILGMSPEVLNNFLKDAYNGITSDLIKVIQRIIEENKAIN